MGTPSRRRAARPDCTRQTPEAKKRVREYRDDFESALSDAAAARARRGGSTQVRDADVEDAHRDLMRPARRRRGWLGLLGSAGLVACGVMATALGAVATNIATNELAADRDATGWWVACAALALVTFLLAAYREFGRSGD